MVQSHHVNAGIKRSDPRKWNGEKGDVEGPPGNTQADDAVTLAYLSHNYNNALKTKFNKTTPNYYISIVKPSSYSHIRMTHL